MLTGNKNLDIDILNRLEDEDLVNACQTNKAADEICTDQNFWLQRIMTKFPEVPLEVLKKYKRGRSWSEYYIKDLRKVSLDPQTYLMKGGRSGKMDWLMISIAKGADINHKYKGDNTALIFASTNGKLEAVKYLVENGADIHFFSEMALRTASYHGQLDIVKFLDEKGADIHIKDDEPLVYASTGGYLDVVKYLVDRGAEVTSQNNNAVISASIKGHLPVVKYLVSKGSDPRDMDDEAVILAHEGGHNDVVDYLVSLGAPDPR